MRSGYPQVYPLGNPPILGDLKVKNLLRRDFNEIRLFHLSIG